jgi:hypothetical protein
MCDQAISLLGDAQYSLTRHLASSCAATKEQLFQLNRKVDELKGQAEEVHQHQLSFHHGAVENTKKWTALADQGKLVDAVKEARIAHGLDMFDAASLVKAYRDRKYAFAHIPPKEA